MPDRMVGVWVGGLLLAPIAAALLSFALGLPVWVYLVPIFATTTICAGPSIIGQKGTALLVGGLVVSAAVAAILSLTLDAPLVDIFALLGFFTLGVAMSMGAGGPPAQPDPDVRRGLRPVRAGWVAGRFGLLLGGAVVTLYFAGYVAAHT